MPTRWPTLLERAGADVVRTGSRGMLWLEPLVEVETAAGRVGYGPVAPEDVDGLVAAGLLEGTAPGLGLVEELDWMRHQQRLTFARVGVIDPLSAEDHEAHGGLAGLRAALAMDPADVVAAVTDSGLRGRGGAGFPTGIKWKTVLGADSELKFVCCNADEGDSGTFADRMLMEGDPFTLIEGMTIAAHAVGASEGYVYIRSEYPDAIATVRAAIDVARGHGWLGERILGSDLSFDLRRPRRCRRVHLRRGDLDAGEPRGQARAGAGQAADPRIAGPVRPPDGGQQRAVAGGGALDPRARRGRLRRLRDRPLARHQRLPARRQRRPRRRSSRPRSASRWASW